MVEYSITLPDEELLPSPAPLLKRSIAFLIDLLVFNFIIYSLFMAVFKHVSGLSEELLTLEYVSLNPSILGAFTGAVGASLVLLLAYFALFEYVFGMTIGKQFLGLKITAKNPNISTFIARNIFKSLLLPLLPIDLLGYAFTSDKQRFIDKALGVRVLSLSHIQLVRGVL